ncbi:TIGR02757 family protein [Membranihabitans marinus]|uniref:TIGR02757 family protein n=1 Tax=Membranihabitans marinus TaxID=1227546 RepID=UPI0021BD8F4B|nr:TIGR02757 family protein [Membranihabitans marinus]
MDQKAQHYENESFIVADPISIPHRFSAQADIEIAGLFAAVFAWGLRKTIISKSLELLQLMDNSPHDFILNHTDQDLQRLEHFKHRTFQPADTLYFVHFLHEYYQKHSTLEEAFRDKEGGFNDLESGLIEFRNRFFDSEYALQRTKKHIPSPARKSATKRLNMYLRWMVRSSDRGVDFGLWKNIKPAQLYIPLDVHVTRVARHLCILSRDKNDWTSVVELTNYLRTLDPADPVKYDFALFNMGLEGERF